MQTAIAAMPAIEYCKGGTIYAMEPMRGKLGMTCSNHCHVECISPSSLPRVINGFIAAVIKLICRKATHHAMRRWKMLALTGFHKIAQINEYLYVF